MPPLWANAESPTYGCEDQGLRFASSDTKRETSRSSREVGLRDAVEPHLQHEARDDRHEVRVAATLAEAVDRALHLTDALGDRRERVRHGALGVVVHVDAERRPHVRLDGPDHLDELGRQRTAVGVAQDQPVGARRLGGLQGGQRVVAVGAEAVEEVLGVEDALPRIRGWRNAIVSLIIARFSASVVPRASVT